jgi:hypothetical protein
MCRSLALVLTLFGCAAPGSPPQTPGSAPPTSVPVSTQAAATSPTIPLCVVQDNRLRKVEGVVNPTTGDTLVGGRPFSEIHPPSTPPYAGAMPWFQDNTGDFIDLSGTIYVRYGVAREGTMIRPDPTALVRVGDLQGVPIFADRGKSPPFDDIFLPVRPGCTLEPYQRQPGDRLGAPPTGSRPIHGRGAPAGRLLIATPVQPEP